MARLCLITLLSAPQRNHGYQGYHQTLRAVCLKKGVYASRTFYRIDINSMWTSDNEDKNGSTKTSIGFTQDPL